MIFEIFVVFYGWYVHIRRMESIFWQDILLISFLMKYPYNFFLTYVNEGPRLVGDLALSINEILWTLFLYNFHCNKSIQMWMLLYQILTETLGQYQLIICFDYFFCHCWFSFLYSIDIYKNCYLPHLLYTLLFIIYKILTDVCVFAYYV